MGRREPRSGGHIIIHQLTYVKSAHRQAASATFPLSLSRDLAAGLFMRSYIIYSQGEKYEHRQAHERIITQKF